MSQKSWDKIHRVLGANLGEAASPYAALAAKAEALRAECAEIVAQANKAASGDAKAQAIVDNMARKADSYEAKCRLMVKALKAAEGHNLSEATGLDPDGEKLYDVLWNYASNDGDSYRKKDAAGAIKKAWAEWQKDRSRDERETYQAIEKKLVKDLGARWAKGEA
jgi:CRISPR/Cas system type I-B associated protein Csh2 (Cas7 group RAMP superfamily)